MGIDDDPRQVTPGVQFIREDGHDAHARLVEAHNLADSAFGRVCVIGIERIHIHGPRLISNLRRVPEDNEARARHLDEERLQGRRGGVESPDLGVGDEGQRPEKSDNSRGDKHESPGDEEARLIHDCFSDNSSGFSQNKRRRIHTQL